MAGILSAVFYGDMYPETEGALQDLEAAQAEWQALEPSARGAWLEARGATLREAAWGRLAQRRAFVAGAPGTPLHTLNGRHAFQGDTWRLALAAPPGAGVAVYETEHHGNVFGVLEMPLFAVRLL